MLCVISHIWEDIFNNTNENHRKQINTVIKTAFYDLSDDELHVTIDTFWSEYTHLNQKNDCFESDEFI